MPQHNPSFPDISEKSIQWMRNDWISNDLINEQTKEPLNRKPFVISYIQRLEKQKAKFICSFYFILVENSETNSLNVM